LKPENILIQSDGYIVLADFGLAKIKPQNGDEPNSFCGSYAYISPEMTEGSGHDHTIDWWALGILIYELIIGVLPFYHPKEQYMYNLIKKAEPKWPDPEKHGISVSQEAKDLILKLLIKDRKGRLGQQGDVDEVLAHPFFSGINLEALLSK